jgi:hypothetical protein
MSDTSPNPSPRIPVQIEVDGVRVSGEIVFLRPNGMSVVITEPTSGFGTSLHVPWFMAGSPKFQLCSTTGITNRGRVRAEDLLKELYDYVTGRPTGWGISKVDEEGKWTEAPSPTSSRRLDA